MLGVPSVADFVWKQRPGPGGIDRRGRGLQRLPQMNRTLSRITTTFTLVLRVLFREN